MGKQGAAARACKFIQLYARLLESDENGFGYCCSCGRMTPWQESSGGHFQAKGIHYNAACMEEDNVHLQCEGCNCYLQGNVAGYSQYMQKSYGNEVIEYLEQKSYKRLELEEFRELARIYKQKCKDLAEQKNFKVHIKT